MTRTSFLNIAVTVAVTVSCAAISMAEPADAVPAAKDVPQKLMRQIGSQFDRPPGRSRTLLRSSSGWASSSARRRNST